MSEDYFNRLIAIGDMLESPYPPTVQDGFDMLRDLFDQNCNDLEFVEEVRTMFPASSELRQKVLEMIEQSQRKDSLVVADNPLHSKKALEEMLSSPSRLKIFISYSHKDERFKDDLVTILVPLQNQGILEIWQDRLIEEGDEWYQAIIDAMNTCDMALLLVSKHFLASSFIGREELPNLLQRRKEQGLRVIPIIISECVWQSIPVLRGLQAFPRDGRPLVSFRSSGDRDRAWTEIAKVIEKLAQKL